MHNPYAVQKIDPLILCEASLALCQTDEMGRIKIPSLLHKPKLLYLFDSRWSPEGWY